MSDLLQLLKEIQTDKNIPKLDEASTKNGVILPILQELGWNPFNVAEIQPEYSVGGKKVDYSLRSGNQNKAFIEVKQTTTDLEKHQEQLLNYSFQEGVRLAILTNGIAWWFYLPLHEGSWEQRKFYTIDVCAQPAEEITQKFEDFLLKQNVMSGKALENAESVFRSKQKDDMIQSSIPKAWNKLVAEQDAALVELIAATTEREGGYRPDHSAIVQFLRANPSLAATSSSSPFTHKPSKQENGTIEPWSVDGRAWHLEKRCSPKTRGLLVALDDVITENLKVDSSWSQKNYVSYKIGNNNWLYVNTHTLMLALEFYVKPKVFAEQQLAERLNVAEYSKAQSTAEKMGLASSVFIAKYNESRDHVVLRIKEGFDLKSDSFLAFLKDAYNAFYK